MKKVLFFLWTAVCALALSAAGVTIADGQKSVYTVVVPTRQGIPHLTNMSLWQAKSSSTPSNRLPALR